MGAAIKGSKGGSKKPRAPYIAPDSARSVVTAKMLYILSEGEIVGPANGMRSITLEGTPLQDDGGNISYPGVQYDFRPGTVDQSAIPGFPDTSNETSVGVELRHTAPWVRAFNNPDLSAVRVRLAWPQLHVQKSNGDMVGVRIQYAIDVATDGGAYQTVIDAAVDDKVSSRYERAHRIDLPPGSSWLLRIRRLTANQGLVTVADTMLVDAVAEVIDAKLRYPHTAMLSLQYDSSQFQSVAKFSVLAKGRIIQVPSNYDPETRLYTGIWDGTFKRAYTNNPAWVWYDLVLHPRYGLGRRIKASMINKWYLYQIAQWCDALVPDGKGGMEPRFTCNLYIQTRRQAYSILADIASIFHGNGYWDGSQMVVNADMPDDPVYSYTRANIIDGAIEYKGTAVRDRHTLAMIAWDDPTQNFKTLYEPVEGRDIARGVFQRDIAAIGSTSLGQAQRAGAWALLSEELETRVATFRVGLDGKIPRPGRVINLADELLQGRPNGGRIQAATATSITVDRTTPINPGSRIIVNLPSGRSQTRTVRALEFLDGHVAGSRSWSAGSKDVYAGQEGTPGRVVVLSTPLDEVPVPDAVWLVDADDLAAMQFRVSTIRRPEFHQFEITGTLHQPGKYAAIDHGARIEPPPISVIPAGVQAPPTNVLITQSVMIEQTMAVTTMTIAWDAVEGAIAYAVEWRKDNAEWISMPRTGGLSADVRGVYTGQYLARVRAINSIDVQSLPANSMLTDITGKAGQPPAPAYLSTASIIFGIGLSWGFPEGAGDTLRTEVEYNTQPREENAMHLGDYAYPMDAHTMAGLAAAVVFYFRARLVDRTGNVGPWTDWVMGQSSADADEILDYIAGQISETELAGHLRDEIALIPEMVSDIEHNATAIEQEAIDRTADIAAEALARQQAVEQETIDRIAAIDQETLARQQDIAQEATARTTAIQAEATARQQDIDNTNTALATAADELDARMDSLQAEIADVVGAAEFDPATPYLSGTVVKYDGKLWRANEDIPAGNPPPYAAWEKIGNYDSLGEAVAAHSAQIATNANRITQTEDGLVAQADRTDAIAVRVTDAEDDLAGQALSISTISAEVSNIDDRIAAEIVRTDGLAVEVGDNRTSIATEQQARINGDSLLSGQIEALSVESGSNSAAILAEQQARIDGDAALANDITIVQAAAAAAQDTAEAAGDIAVQNTAAITSEATARADADQALATDISLVATAAGDNSAAIIAESQARTSADETLATQINQVSVSAGENSAAITAEAEARANADAALATRVDGVFAQINPPMAGDTDWMAGSTTVAAGVWSEQSARAEADLALGRRVDATTAQINDNRAALVAEEEARVTADEATAARMDLLSAGFANSSAAIIAESRARTDADSALAQQVITVSASADAAHAAAAAASDDAAEAQGSAAEAQQGVAQNTAAIQAETTARADADSALATDINTVQAAAAAAQLGVEQNTAAIQNEATARADADQALATDISLVATAAGDNSAAIIAESQARTSADETLATQINQVSVSAGENSAAITAEAEARANADAALATRVDGVFAQINPPMAGDADWMAGSTTVAAGVWSEQSARAEADLALGRRVDATTAQINDNRAALVAEEEARVTADEATAARMDLLSAGFANSSAAIIAESRARTDADSALAQQVVTVSASADAAHAAAAAASDDAAEAQGAATEAQQGVAQNTAAIQAETTARADADTALATDINTVQAAAAAAQLGVEQNTAAIQNESTARADADSALSEQVATLQVTVNDEISAAVQNLQQAVADESSARASDISTVQAEVATVSGQAQAAQDAATDAAGLAGTAKTAADQAAEDASSASAAVQQTAQAVADLEGDLSTMWSVKMQVNANGQYVYAGVGLGIENGPGGLQSQFLVEANRFALLNTINGVTTTPFVVEGGQLIANKAIFKQADIINLIITGVLQSPDYVAATSGIRLNFVTGQFELNGSVPGQGRTTVSNKGVKVLDASGGVRVQIGDMSS